MSQLPVLTVCSCQHMQRLQLKSSHATLAFLHWYPVSEKQPHATCMVMNSQKPIPYRLASRVSASVSTKTFKSNRLRSTVPHKHFVMLMASDECNMA